MPRKETISKQKKKTEIAVKKYIKARDRYICQRSGEYCKGSNCHASHIIPVSTGNQYRFDPENMIVLTYHNHINWWHKNPIEAAEWFKKKFPERYDYLFALPRVMVKFSIEDLKDIETKYKLKLKEYEEHQPQLSSIFERQE